MWSMMTDQDKQWSQRKITDSSSNSYMVTARTIHIGTWSLLYTGNVSISPLIKTTRRPNRKLAAESKSGPRKQSTDGRNWLLLAKSSSGSTNAIKQTRITMNCGCRFYQGLIPRKDRPSTRINWKLGKKPQKFNLKKNFRQSSGKSRAKCIWKAKAIKISDWLIDQVDVSRWVEFETLSCVPDTRCEFGVVGFKRKCGNKFLPTKPCHLSCIKNMWLFSSRIFEI